MIVLNLRDGSTAKFDLSLAEDVRRLNNFGRNFEQAKRVSGIWLSSDKYNSTLPIPSGFRRIHFQAEQIVKKDGTVTGERLVVQADDVRLLVTSYYGEKPRMVRIDLKHTGKQVFLPDLEGGSL